MSLWIPIRDCDSRAVRLYRRHYSAPPRRDWSLNQRITGPGEYLMLLTPGADALFAWRVFMEVNRDKPLGVNCAIFRNESDYLSSDLILEAEAWARRRWPTMGWMYTYVDPRKVLSSNPGYCFKVAGWRTGPPTGRGLVSLWKRTTDVSGVVGEAEALPSGQRSR